ncbi:MAG: DUF1549 domain-containing protein [Polyangiaceae bacterium]|nr:DUF1549 domain-containing protein [Polyangiaceae bacterium]
MHASSSLLTFAVAAAIAAGCSAAPASSSGPEGSSDPAAAAADASASAAIDRVLASAWSEKGIKPSGDVDDATFLRRATIDIAGRIPTSAEVRAFLDDTAADKRARAVDRLLAGPEHDRHMARTWESILLGNEVKNRVVDRAALRNWLERKFTANAAWDSIVREIVTAEGLTSLGGARQPGAAMIDDPERAGEEAVEGISGPANYFVRFAKSPQDLAGTTSRAFLGVQIQCAQCHDHKTEAWKQSDFRSFASAMSRVAIQPVDRTKGQMNVFEVKDSRRTPRRLMRDDELKAIAEAEPRALDGTSFDDAENVREALGTWMTSRQNPWFSRAIANRVWAEMFGAGLVEPVDDLRPNNPAVVPEALDLLAEGFEASGYDLDYLYRTIANTSAYARAVEGGKESPRAALFSKSALRPLTSDVLLDSLFVATDLEKILEDRAPAKADRLKAGLRRKLRFTFEEDTESNGDSYDGTLQQALFSMNGGLPIAATSVAPSTVLESLVKKSDDEAIAELWLRTFSRLPTPAEIDEAKAFLAKPHEAGGDAADAPAERRGKRGKGKGKGKAAKLQGAGALPPAAMRSTAKNDRERGYEDLFWALLNASELHFRR